MFKAYITQAHSKYRKQKRSLHSAMENNPESSTEKTNKQINGTMNVSVQK